MTAVKTLTLNTTGIKEKKNGVIITGNFTFENTVGKYSAEIMQDTESDNWVLCTGIINNTEPVFFATYKNAFELHRGVAWSLTKKQMAWNKLTIASDKDLMTELDTILGGAI